MFSNYEVQNNLWNISYVCVYTNVTVRNILLNMFGIPPIKFTSECLVVLFAQ